MKKSKLKKTLKKSKSIIAMMKQEYCLIINEYGKLVVENQQLTHKLDLTQAQCGSCGHDIPTRREPDDYHKETN